jgi:zinc D-Ala-D-Ala carboxypeptidase
VPALSRRHARYVGRRRAIPEQVQPQPRGVRRTVGAVTAIGIAAGAVGVTQALPQRAEASPHERSARATAAVGPALAAGTVTAAVARPAVARVTEPVATASTAARSRVVKVSRSVNRNRFGSCDGSAVTRGHANGRIPLDELCRVTFAPGHRLRADAAVGLMRLDVAFRARFHRHLGLTDSYRSYRSQVSVAARKPGLAAKPGTSEHGWGLAVDVAGGAADPDAREHLWLLANAPKFGWDNPKWARPDGSRPEPWHWEYGGGRTPSS